MNTATATTQTPFLQINMRTHMINGAKGAVGLTPREYSLLAYLVNHAGSPVSRDELLSVAWGWNYASELKTKTVDMHVSRLRTKLKRAGLDPSTISTVRGRGYSFVAKQQEAVEA